MEQASIQKRGISASTLKIIAVCSMLVDHFAISIYLLLPENSYAMYRMLRYIGRIAFPIYCFLLVEGFFHTKNVKKYIARCFAFALISEIPFDMAGYGQVFFWRHQNVFFTLTIGLLVLYGFKIIRDKYGNNWLLQIAVVLAGAGLAQILEVDYHYMGVLFIVMFYYCKNVNKWLRDIIGVCAFAYEVTAPLAFIPIHFYDGRRGLRLKYVFYCIYPVHLFIFGLIRIVLLQ